MDAFMPRFRLGHHFRDHHERHPIVRQGRLLHGPVPLRRDDHLLHPRPDLEGSRSRTLSHVPTQDGQPSQTHGLAGCGHSGLIFLKPTNFHFSYDTTFFQKRLAKLTLI